LGVDPALAHGAAGCAGVDRAVQPPSRVFPRSHRAFGPETDEEKARRDAVFAGKLPLSNLPPRWMTALSENRAHVDGLLRATHASIGRLLRPLTVFGRPRRSTPAPSARFCGFGCGGARSR